mgnify:CR=1 FL=1
MSAKISRRSHRPLALVLSVVLPFAAAIAASASEVTASEVKVSSFGYDSEDSTELDFSTGPAAAPAQPSGSAAMARAALQELGYSAAEINAALKGVDPNATTEEMVRYGLRQMVMKG